MDTLSFCLRDGTRESYLSSVFLFFFKTKCSCFLCVCFYFFFFFFWGGGGGVFIYFIFLFFFKTKFTVSGAYIWHGWCKTRSGWHAWLFFQKFALVTFVMWTENKLFSRKGISWKQNDNLITQYEHEQSLLVPDFIYLFFQPFWKFFFFF